MKTGLYTGRFQPFHLGHLSAVKQALNNVDFLYIGIGSAQYSHEEYNPFTADERKEIIEKTLEENQIPKNRYKIIPIPDIHDNAAWPKHVRSLVPQFEIVFVGDDGLVKKLFEEHTDIPVKIVKHELDISATKIREAIVNNENWRKYLSKSTIGYLGEINGIKRIQNL